MNKFVHCLLLVSIVSLSCSTATDLLNGGSDAGGPILAVVTAASLDEHGQLVDESYSFVPAVPQVTVVVQVGALQAAAPLSIAWYRAGDAGDEKLFEHTVQVESFDRAYSVGLNPGLLALGAYKAVVGLSGQNQTITWMVAEAETEPELETSQSANAAQTQQGKAPASGSSGKVPASQRTAAQPPAIPGCTLTAVAAPQAPNLTVAGAVLIGDATSCASLGTGDLLVMASIAGGQPKQACHFSLTSGLSCTSRGDPCDLPGGSDLPGTVVNVTLQQKSTGQVLAHDTATFGADTAKPQVTLVSDPSNGVKVVGGQKIKLTGIAEEKKSGGWQTGVSKIEIMVMQPSADTVGEESYDAYSGKACSAKSWKQTTKEFTYTVPKGVNGDLYICAFGYDFAGNIGTDCATLPTGDKLKGKLSLASTDTVTTAAITQTGTHQTDAELSLTLQGDGTVTGTADVTYAYHVEGTQKCGGFSSIMIPNPAHFSVQVTGTWTKDRIVFRMVSDGPIEQSFTDNTCGTATNYDSDVTAAALGGEWQADKVGNAYTAEKALKATASSTTHWTIRLTP